MNKAVAAILLLFAVTHAEAGNPKWMNRSRNAICDVIVYDSLGNETGRGTGFFTDAEGTGISEYSLFLNAAKAITIDGKGVEREIRYIIGADRTYNVIRFKSDADRKLPFLTITHNSEAENETLFLPVPSTKGGNNVQFTIAKSERIEGDRSYYTLYGDMQPGAAGLPVFNADGLVVGIIQDIAPADTCNYALDSRYADSLSITSALSLNNDTYRSLTFPTALPDTEEQALVYLYMQQAGSRDNYLRLLDQFIEQYPANAEGYFRKGTFYVSNDSTRSAEGIALLDKAVLLSTDNGGTLFDYARLIYTVLTSDIPARPASWTLDDALEKIDSALGYDRQPAYIQQKGNILFALKRYAEALECYNELNGTPLASPETYYYTSVIKNELKYPQDEIIETLDSAVNFYGKPYTSKVSPFILERATTKENLGRHREAVMDLNEYEQILGATGLSAEFYYFREQIEIKAHMYEQAVNDISHAVYLAPADLGLRLEQASLYLRIGMVDEAMPLTEHLTAENPENPDCRRLLGICLMRSDRKDEARIHLEKAKELGDQLAGQLLQSLED